MPAFGIAVSSVGNGSATLSWMPPTQQHGRLALTNLAGYRIYYGTSAGTLNRTVQIANPGIASYVVGNLTPATWYFSVRPYNSAGAESCAGSPRSRARGSATEEQHIVPSGHRREGSD